MMTRVFWVGGEWGEYVPVTKAAGKITKLVFGNRAIINKPGLSFPQTEVAL